jgi:hypothetical protein
MSRKQWRKQSHKYGQSKSLIEGDGGMQIN